MTSEDSNQRQARVQAFVRRHRIGLLTLLFTDMVESTRLKQTLGDQRAAALIQRHHALIREVLSAFLEGDEIEGVRAPVWLNHGCYRFKGVEDPVEVCEVGEEGLAPPRPPSHSQKGSPVQQQAPVPLATAKKLPRSKTRSSESLFAGLFKSRKQRELDQRKERRRAFRKAQEAVDEVQSKVRNLEACLPSLDELNRKLQAALESEHASTPSSQSFNQRLASSQERIRRILDQRPPERDRLSS